MSVEQINRLGLQAWLERFGGVFEHSPWVAQGAWASLPFASVEELHRAMMELVRGAPLERKLQLARAHPELAGREAQAGALTVDSSSEQARLGFTALSSEEFRKMAALNRGYREKFGFPCIVALRLHSSRESVMAEMEKRLANDADTELANALEQIGHITRDRLAKILGEE